MRALTPRHGVLIVAGDDWSSETPYYSERKALMLKSNDGHDAAFLDAAFARLAGEEIAALLITGTERQNSQLIARSCAAFDLDPEIAFAHEDTDVYLPKSRSGWAVTRLRDAPVFAGVIPLGTSPAQAVSQVMDEQVRAVNSHSDLRLFGHMAPMPVRYHFSFNAEAGSLDGQPVVGAHPDAELWFVAPRRAQRITCSFGILPAAYERTGAATDGVEFTIIHKKPDGPETVLFRRRLQPSEKPEDRGMQHAEIPCGPVSGGELIFVTRPAGNYAYDWAYWGQIKID